MTKKRKDYGTGIPRRELEGLAGLLLQTMQAFYESEEGQREFEEWKKKQDAAKEVRHGARRA